MNTIMKSEKNNTTLMQRLLDAGYPREEMDHHDFDLYVYATPLTMKIVEAWCREHGYDRNWQCPIFHDQITGRLMYDCAFQYTDYWVEKASLSSKAAASHP